MLIVALETSTDLCSAALGEMTSDGCRVIAELHRERIGSAFGLILDLLEANRLGARDIGGWVVGDRPARTERLSEMIRAALSLAAHAGPVATDDPALHADVEIDPTAYALDGNSLHVGLARGALRLDLGNFGLALPSALVDDGFAARFDGFGAKLQWFPRTPQRGLFVGADAAVGRVQIERRGAAQGSDGHRGDGTSDACQPSAGDDAPASRARRSAGVRSRHWPGGSRRSVTGPIRTRTSRSTGCPTASSIRRT